MYIYIYIYVVLGFQRASLLVLPIRLGPHYVSPFYSVLLPGLGRPDSGNGQFIARLFKSESGQGHTARPRYGV